tara:strand:- start:69 stop:1073 length:1005 start_codon:yes stop_codon:yes gene_type:complete
MARTIPCPDDSATRTIPCPVLPPAPAGFAPPVITANDIIAGNEYAIVQSGSRKCAVMNVTSGEWFEAVGIPSWALNATNNRCPLYMSGAVAYNSTMAINGGAGYIGYNVVTGQSVTRNLPNVGYSGYKRLVRKPGGAVGTALLLSSTGQVWDCNLINNTATALGYLNWNGSQLDASTGNKGYQQPRACYDHVTQKVYIGWAANTGEYWHVLDTGNMTATITTAPIGTYYAIFEDSQFVYNGKSYHIDRFNGALLHVWDIASSQASTQTLPSTWSGSTNSDAYAAINGKMFIGFSNVSTGTFTGAESVYIYDTQSGNSTSNPIGAGGGCFIGGTQ